MASDFSSLPNTYGMSDTNPLLKKLSERCLKAILRHRSEVDRLINKIQNYNQNRVSPVHGSKQITTAKSKNQPKSTYNARKNNIVIHGIFDTPESLKSNVCEKVKAFIKDKLNANNTPVEAFPLEKPATRTPVLV